MHLLNINCIRGPPDHLAPSINTIGYPSPAQVRDRPVLLMLRMHGLFSNLWRGDPGPGGLVKPGAGVGTLGGFSRLPGVSSGGPLPAVLDSQWPLGLDASSCSLPLPPLGQAADTCGGCGPGAAPPAVRGLSLLGVEDRPGQEESRPRGPWLLPGLPSFPGTESGHCWGPAYCLLAAQKPWASASSQHRWGNPARAVQSREGSMSGLLRPSKDGHTLQRPRETFLGSVSAPPSGERS